MIKSCTEYISRRLSLYRIYVIIFLVQRFIVLYDSSQLRKSVSDFEYFLKLFVGVDDDNVTLGTVGDVPARVRRVCRVHSSCQTTACSIAHTLNVKLCESNNSHNNDQCTNNCFYSHYLYAGFSGSVSGPRGFLTKSLKTAGVVFLWTSLAAKILDKFCYVSSLS